MSKKSNKSIHVSQSQFSELASNYNSLLSDYDELLKEHDHLLLMYSNMSRFRDNYKSRCLDLSLQIQALRCELSTLRNSFTIK